jgi:choline kinase
MILMADNDTQYGNLLKLDSPPPHRPSHHSYIVIDFEYAAPNARGYDIANHFHEWRANYHHPTHSHSLIHFPYPDQAQKENFYRAYLSVEMDHMSGAEVIKSRKDVAQDKVEKLDYEVRAWSPACSVFWALWGIIQAGEQVENILTGDGAGVEFDYLVRFSFWCLANASRMLLKNWNRSGRISRIWA